MNRYKLHEPRPSIHYPDYYVGQRWRVKENGKVNEWHQRRPLICISHIRPMIDSPQNIQVEEVAEELREIAIWDTTFFNLTQIYEPI